MLFSGSIVALVTPMDDRARVDFEALERLVNWQIESGTDALVAVGTTGESATLTADENIQVIECVMSATRDRVPVIAGTGSNATQKALESTREAYNLGVDGVLLVAPYYNKPEQEGLYQHYRLIAESVPVPVIIYNVPGRTVTDISNATVARLAEIENIVACKDATGDLTRGAELIELCDDKLSVLSGDDASALSLMKLGAKGNITVTGNVAPKEMHQLCRTALQGDFKAADHIEQKLQRLNRDLFLESSPIPVKYALAKMGFGSNSLRLPLTPLKQQYEACVQAALSDIEVVIS